MNSTTTRLLVFLAVSLVMPAAWADEWTFRREVRPILAEFCFRCHGFDEHSRQAGLRLDDFATAIQPAESGARAIVPKHPEHSELLRRVLSDDAELRMPPPSSGKRLSAEQIATLRRWIAAGAEYAPHWAFSKPRRSPVPTVIATSPIAEPPRNVIDHFVRARMIDARQNSADRIAQLGPNAPADPARLLRRLSLDLIGLPPTVAELDHFLAASRLDPDLAYAAEIERLLASPHFGERMAIEWLDAARYADTNGYFGDKPRVAWPWRDWVIRAFNENKPFDEFTIEQLAGDLLPNATREQRVATGFHRNSMANNETGIIDEEYRVEAVADRVETTGTVWLGLTIGCAQCHDHKYDPITQREYYGLFAYFNQSVEPGLIHQDDPPPTIEVPTPEQSELLQRRQRELEEAKRDFAAGSKSLDAELERWSAEAERELVLPPSESHWSTDFETAFPSLPKERGVLGQAGKFDGTQIIEALTDFDVDRAWSIAVWAKPAASLACLWSKIEPNGDRRGIELIWQKGRLQLHLVSRWGADELAVTTKEPLTANEWHHVLVSYDGQRSATGLHVIVDGIERAVTVQRDALSGSLKNSEPLRIGRRDPGLGYYGLLDEFRVWTRALPTSPIDWPAAERLRGVLARPMSDRNGIETTLLREHFIARHAPEELRLAERRLRQSERLVAAARAAIPTTLVMQDRPEPRRTQVLIRGQYDNLGPEVQPDVPSGLGASLPSHWKKSPNRLALAHWLVSPDNPLTARVVVNRLWQQCFGEGLVRTPNDFGTQGELPTHPELLDELAVRLIESGWDIKALLRLIVSSATYRQDSRPRMPAGGPRIELLDPENRLLSRGPRFRLSAELVRDQAIAAAGLLVPTVGGPSVRPFQPEGLWEEVSYNEEDSYVPDVGAGLWRRSLYTYWKRQVPPPSMLIFDANTREKCLVKRSRTNTPLQALVLLNDETYVVAARALAANSLEESAGHAVLSDTERLRTLFRRVTSRIPEPEETQVLLRFLDRQRRLAAQQDASTSELTAWTQLAHTLLNLDEAITRR